MPNDKKKKKNEPHLLEFIPPNVWSFQKWRNRESKGGVWLDIPLTVLKFPSTETERAFVKKGQVEEVVHC